MEYYVLANEDIVKFESREAAELFAYTMLDDEKVEYLEYGVIDYDGWQGMSTLAILKPTAGGTCDECLISG